MYGSDRTQREYLGGPLFLNPAVNDYRVGLYSPMVDAGDSSVPDLPDRDLRGQSRIVDGDGNGQAIIDMGAYEFNPSIIEPKASHLFPMPSGKRWTYRQQGGTDAVNVQILRQKVTIDDVVTTVFHYSDDGSEEFYTNDSRGVRLHRVFQPNVRIQGLGRVDLELTFQPPITLLSPRPSAWQTVSSSGIARTNSLPYIGVLEITYSARFTVRGWLDVTVPAGNFHVMQIC